MAITMRHGPYNKFDPQKLRTGELAVVTEGDPHASDGKAIYQCFSPGDVKRMATYEDMVDQIDEAGGEAIDNHIEEKVGAALKACENATKAAQDAKTNADKAVSGANTAASSASTAAETASEAAETASKAAEDCRNLIDEKHVAEIKKAVQQSLMADAADGTVTGKTVTDLPENTAPADTDYFLGATGNAVKKTTVAQAKELFGVNSGLKLLEVTTVKFKAPSTASGASTGTITTAFNVADGATVFVPIYLASGWLTPASCSAVAGKLNVSFINATTAVHSTDATFLVLQFGAF